MKDEKRIPSSLLLIVLFSVLCCVPSAFSADWNDLYGLDEKQLTTRIDAFEQKLSKSSQDYEMLKALGIAYHFKAGMDADAFASTAVDYLTEAYELKKKDYVTMCYLGAATSRMAQTTWNPISKMSYSNTGMGLMDKAVRKAPDNVTIRMTRGKTSLDMPSFLGRGDLVVEDFEYIAGLIEQNPGAYDSIKEEVQQILEDNRLSK